VGALVGIFIEVVFMDMDQIVHAYAIGPQLLRDAVAGLSADQMCERPIEGT